MCLGLHLLVLEVTGRCNLSCSYCYRGGDSSRDIRDPLRLMDHIAGVNPYIINLSGGEPLIFNDLFNFAEIVKKTCRKLFLTTNGTLLNEERMYKLFQSGIHMIDISIDAYYNDTYGNL